MTPVLRILRAALLVMLCVTTFLPTPTGADASYPAASDAACVDDKIKDCSKMKDCWARCQCKYDNCKSDVNTCIKEWHKCREDCK